MKYGYRKIKFFVWYFLLQRLERAQGVFWMNGYPIMKLDDKPIFNQTPIINSKLNYFSQEHPYPVPVSEGN